MKESDWYSGPTAKCPHCYELATYPVEPGTAESYKNRIGAVVVCNCCNQEFKLGNQRQ